VKITSVWKYLSDPNSRVYREGWLDTEWKHHYITYDQNDGYLSAIDANGELECDMWWAHKDELEAKDWKVRKANGK